MSIQKVYMPGLGESVHEASISTWLVKPGEHIEKYEPLAEAVSDKVVTEIPSDIEGEVKDFLIDLDEEVPIGTAIMEVEVEGEEEETPAVVETAAACEVPAADKTQAENVSTKSERSHDKKKRYSPAVLELAEERGINLDDVVGSGANGRITRKDVMNYQPKTVPAEENKTMNAAPELTIAEEKKSQTVSAPVVTAAKTEAAAVKTELFMEDESVPADGIRRAIAKKMVQSSTEIPHAWQVIEVDVTNVVRLRNQVKEDFKKQEGIKLSYFPFFVKAIVQALKKNPKLNSSWQGDKIIYHKNLNMSIAVATEDNLYTPVIQNADQLSIKGLAKEIDRLATAVRTNQLSSKDMQNGTFTINNTGSFGSLESMGIINYPQAAIIQVESINKRIVPMDDGSFKVCDMVNLCLSIDHRILDGLQAGRFLQDVKKNLAQFTNENCLY